MEDNLKSLESKVKGCADLKRGVVELVNGVAGLLDGLTHDPVAIKAMADNMRQNAEALGNALCSAAGSETGKHEPSATSTASSIPASPEPSTGRPRPRK
jgi:hypothetical protein